MTNESNIADNARPVAPFRALIAGATGITGRYLAEHLVSLGWEVHGLARNPSTDLRGVHPVAADLLQPDSIHHAIKGIDPTHIFFTTWLRQPTEEENCQVNGAMVENLLSAVGQSRNLRHVGLITGGKGYFGSFDDIGKYEVTSPFREDQPRKPGPNFYYTQEDILFDHARRSGFTWNVHRPTSAVIGYAPGNSMNMGTTLAVYATICKATGRPFVFPGSPVQHEGIGELTDASILAQQVAWAAVTSDAQNETMNVANGDLFRWKWMWEQIAEYFDLEVAEYPGHATPLVGQLKGAESIWDDIVSNHGLRSYRISDLAPAWHTDADLSRPFEAFADLSKSRSLGFHGFKKSTDSLFDIFDKLRNEKIIP